MRQSCLDFCVRPFARVGPRRRPLAPRRGRALLAVAAALFALVLAACTPPAPPTPPPDLTASPQSLTATPPPPPTPPPAQTPTPLPSPTATPTPAPISLAIAPSVPPDLRALLEQALAPDRIAAGRPIEFAPVAEAGANLLAFHPLDEAPADPLAVRVFAVVAPFATVPDDVSLAELRGRWTGEGEKALLVEEGAALALLPVFGDPPTEAIPAEEMLAQLQARPGSLGILPFERLEPRFKVMAVEGANPLSNQFQVQGYPLAVVLAVTGPDAALLASHLDGAVPAANRDPDRLTTLIMTGVTAMSRGTAEKMERHGYLYPALVISDTLRAADITHVSNEVPFIAGCPVRNVYMQLELCSDYPYWAALEAIGVDIVGLSGNHINDFGGARESLAFYRERDIPIYGSGLNEEEACAPLLWEHNDNTFAFIAALAWWPEDAWATATEPGACYYYRNYERILALVRELSQTVDVVAVELQHHETYNPWPTVEQVADFRELQQAGAAIVTGVQSHVPQALEPYRDSMIVYGLGNLFFDQMFSWEVRTGLIARHAIYEGRLLSTEILTTVLEDYAQPRWATPQERVGVLASVFAAAPPPPGAPLPTPTPTPPSEESGRFDRSDESDTPEPTAPMTQTVTAQAPPAEPGLPWPAPVDLPEDHFWLARPNAPGANQIAASTYGFGSTGFGRYRIHHGVDIANPTGTPLYAPDAATVVHAGPDQPPNVLGPYPDFYGNTILFRLDRAWRDQPVFVLYGHLHEVFVASGQHVERGQPVGTVGMTGIAIGPHVHVEARLGGSDYDSAYNAELWLEPLPGRGVVAGQVVSPDGRAWHERSVLLYRIETDGTRLYRSIPTYANDTGLRPDPDWAENFLLGDVPAGDYVVVVRIGAITQRQNLRVEPGRTAYARFVATP